MKAKAIDIRNLKTLGSLSKRNKAEIAQVIELYTNRRIERFDTARNLINNLSSSGKTKQQTGLDRLKYYDEVYVDRSIQYTYFKHRITNRTFKEIQAIEVERKNKAIARLKEFESLQVPLNNEPPVWRLGNMNKPATFIYVIFNSFEPINAEGVEDPYERRDFIEFMNNFKVRLLSEIKNVLDVKPLFKARLRLHMGYRFKRKSS